MDNSETSTVVQLAELNVRFGEWELHADDEQGRKEFGDHIGENFVFRRGDGTTVDKQQFLEDLPKPENKSEELRTEIVQINVFGGQAIVVAHVALKGLRRGDPVDGTFRNIRLFERQEGEWRCVMWFNKGMAFDTAVSSEIPLTTTR